MAVTDLFLEAAAEYFVPAAVVGTVEHQTI